MVIERPVLPVEYQPNFLGLYAKAGFGISYFSIGHCIPSDLISRYRVSSLQLAQYRHSPGRCGAAPLASLFLATL